MGSDNIYVVALKTECDRFTDFTVSIDRRTSLDGKYQVFKLPIGVRMPPSGMVFEGIYDYQGIKEVLNGPNWSKNEV